MTNLLLKFREKMSHKIGQDGILEISKLKGIRLDKTDKINTTENGKKGKNDGLKAFLDFKESECSTVDYLKCSKKSKKRIYFIEFSDLKESLIQIHNDIKVHEKAQKKGDIDEATCERFKNDVWMRLITEFNKKLDGSERIFERLLTQIMHKGKQKWKRSVVIVCRDGEDVIALDFLKKNLTG